RPATRPGSLRQAWTKAIQALETLADKRTRLLLGDVGVRRGIEEMVSRGGIEPPRLARRALEGERLALLGEKRRRFAGPAEKDMVAKTRENKSGPGRDLPCPDRADAPRLAADRGIKRA